MSILNSALIIPYYSYQLLNTLSYSDVPSSFYQKIKFDLNSLVNNNDRIIINFHKNTDLKFEKQKIISICDYFSKPILFDYISSIVCEVGKSDIEKIAQLETVSGIYLDEVVSINVSNPEKSFSYDEIFQLNQCATIINARKVPATGKGVNISIIDTGIDFSHSDLSGKKLAEISFVTTTYGFDEDRVEDAKDYNGHGTHCAGIATGTGISSPPNYNLTGIAPDAKLLNAKCLDRYGSGYLSGVLAAIDWSMQKKASIISMSLGFDISDPDHPICRAVDKATQQGIIVVVAAGNSGPFYSTVGAPGVARSVITVGATNKNDKLTSFSSRGPTSAGFVDPDVVAPGENILSIAAKNSILGKIMELNDGYVWGKNYNDYMILSGTSMACPMVAGAAALLLDAFPNLNPYAVRIALMKGADSLGYTPNSEGMGRINVYNSYNILLNSAPNYNITAILPKSLPTPPLELNLFPGDQYYDEIIIMSSKKTNMSVQCIGNISKFVSLIPITDNLLSVNKTLVYIKMNESYYTNLKIHFNFPLNIIPGIYTGIIEVRNNDTGALLENISLFYNITIPRARIYFDCFHNSDSADSVLSNYHNFSKLLFEKGIDVDFGKYILSYPLLSQYDLLILPDIETPFTNDELNAIKKYWESENGGNILIIGNFYPSTAIEPLNTLLSLLDVSVNYTKTNLENSYDIGMLKYYSFVNITDIYPHPITNGVSSFTWLAGVGLQVDESKASILAKYSNIPVIAAQNTSLGHKIVCFGGERAFYEDLVYKNPNKKLIVQTIQWLLNKSARSSYRDLRVEVVVNESIYELNSINTTQIGFYVSDPTTNMGIENLAVNNNLSCVVYYLNTTGWTDFWIATPSDIQELGKGAYYFNFTTNSIGLFKINITIDNLTTLGDGLGVSYFNTTHSMPKIINYTLKTTNLATGEDYVEELSNDIYRNADSVKINITIYDNDTNNDIINITAIVTSTEAYRSNLKYSIFEFTNLTSKNMNETIYSTTITPDNTFPAGSYVVYIVVIDSKGWYDYKSAILEFYINDRYPTISESRSKLNGVSFNTLKSSYPVMLFHGINFDIEITGSDSESSLSSMHAYVIIFSFFTIGLYAYVYEPLWAVEIPFSESSNSFKGTVKLPSNGISNILGETYNLRGMYILIALLLDSDGQYDDDSYTYAKITVFSSQIITFSIVLIIIIITAILCTVFYLVYYRRRKRSKSGITKIICPNCGIYVPSAKNYCINCGAPLKPNTNNQTSTVHSESNS